MSEKTLEERVFKAMEEMMQVKCKESAERIEKGIEDKFILKEKEIDKICEKCFGLETDPIARRSDLIALERKTALEKAETTKRTPASETPAGPDGNAPPNPIDDLFTKAKKGDLPE